MVTTINIDAVMAAAGVLKENELNVRTYLEKVANDLDFNIDAYELQMMCKAYLYGLNARRSCCTATHGTRQPVAALIAQVWNWPSHLQHCAETKSGHKNSP